jgi:hypothetical protein
MRAGEQIWRFDVRGGVQLAVSAALVLPTVRRMRATHRAAEGRRQRRGELQGFDSVDERPRRRRRRARGHGRGQFRGNDRHRTGPSGRAVVKPTTTSPVIAGEPLNVDATVQNVGNKTALESVRLLVDGTEADREDVVLNPGLLQRVTLVWSTTGNDTGSHTATVLTQSVDVSVE